MTLLRNPLVRLLVVLFCAVLATPALAATEHSTIFILLDGFRWDKVTPTLTPNLQRLADSGVKAEMIPVTPTISSPNHWALATGLYPEHTGIFSNTNYDNVTKRIVTLANQDFWAGEPIWATVARQGKLSGVLGWFIPAQHMPPERSASFTIPYNLECAGCGRITADLLDQLVYTGPWANELPARRPDLLAFYSAVNDGAEHHFGIGSAEADAALKRTDQMIGELMDGLAAHHISDQVNIVIVGDHGQLVVPEDHKIDVDKYVDESLLQTPPIDGFAEMQFWPKPGMEERVYDLLKKAPAHLHVVRRAEYWARYHCCGPRSTPPLVLVADPGWGSFYKGGGRELVGAHGYGNEVRDMHAIFIAAGPDIRKTAQMQPFANVDVYSLLAFLVDVKPAKTDGSIMSMCPILLKQAPECEAAKR
jgi:predicted AlkP superfamily pyrophosphatase or phosphodiesterase